MTVWKVALKLTDEQFITVPLVNRPLCVQMQGGVPCLWSVVDPESGRVQVCVRIFGTGHEGVTGDMDYVGTFQIDGGSLVFHVFLAGVVS